MQDLIKKCWLPSRETRPSFAEIFNDFQSKNFSILPGADDALVQKYASEILEWEETHRLNNRDA
jgi:hypothetical protein